ncbi:uncharacterized protein LOC107048362 [Diachasma alloeum]|uniref:uncharacterized protein LOC107048362 n=1 Tax=Diachasma alloeum TaxID=454923 RepID=UPI00073836A2|nr:uncharacterized protein LOC107048362 [Diachasma alloeum]
MELALQNTQKDIHILTDSLSALQALNHPQLKINVNKYLLQVREKYNHFNTLTPTSRELKFFWIPSHMGIPGNEEADRLAKTATEVIRPEISSLPFTDFKEEFRSLSKKNTSQQLKETGAMKGKVYFRDFYSNSAKPWFRKFKKLRRNTVVWVNRIRANHYNLKASLARIGVVDSPSCECGYPEQDVDHLVWQCRQYDEQRKELISKIKGKCPFPTSMNHIVYMLDPIVIKSIDNFFNQCNLKI